MVNNSLLINQDSRVTEYYTPPLIVDAARRVMRGIDYDPASSERANKIVRATAFSSAPNYAELGECIGDLPVRVYDRTGGLDRPFFGRVWMNHPFSRSERACRDGCKKKRCVDRGYHLGEDLPGNAEWIKKIVEEYEAGNMKQGLMICYASTSETWFRPLLKYPRCWLEGRTNYLDPDTLEPIRGATKGSVVTYFGTNLGSFWRAFSPLGEVDVPYEYIFFHDPESIVVVQ